MSNQLVSQSRWKWWKRKNDKRDIERKKERNKQTNNKKVTKKKKEKINEYNRK